MEEGYLFGRMEEDIKEIISIIKRKVMGDLNGMMGEYMKVVGKMGNKMEKESFIIIDKKDGKKESGKMGKELNGLKKMF